MPPQWRCGELPSWETMPACPGCALGPARGSLWPFPFCRQILFSSSAAETCYVWLSPSWGMYATTPTSLGYAFQWPQMCSHALQPFLPQNPISSVLPLVLGPSPYVNKLLIHTKEPPMLTTFFSESEDLFFYG